MKVELTKEDIAKIEAALAKPGYPRVELSVRGGKVEVVSITRKLI